MIGTIGRVTGTIEPGAVGEVMLPFDGGTSAFHAFAVDGTSTFAVGAKVLVVDFQPPQAVYVDQLPDFLSAG
ncbi:MAG: hypothetical protein DLM59_16980 [Pseudonocardiales bacterium]|nr:MAG: hypothetical protein DLM59_16980 [Pseudonocardiales bacterium]